MAETSIQLFVQLQPVLKALAYRLLGSRHDAEDVLQETWLRWQNTSSLVDCQRAYLQRMVVNLCLDHLRQRQTQQRYVGSWLPEPEFSDSPSPEEEQQQYQQVSFACLHMLEQLNPVERAVFVLREAFEEDFSAIAQTLGKTESNCRQLYSRARRKLHEQPAQRETSPQQHQQLLLHFLWACQQGDVSTLQKLLTQDAILYSDGGGIVKAALRPIYGAAKSIRLLLALTRKQPTGLTWQLQLINGRWAIVTTLAEQRQAMITVCGTDAGIEAMYFQLNPQKLCD